jgi:hypothetical protein
MAKPWHEMTPAERMADRIAKNREIDQRVSEKTLSNVSKAAPRSTAQKAAKNALDKFQEIKKTQGVDAAAEFVRKRKA